MSVAVEWKKKKKKEKHETKKYYFIRYENES